MSLLARRLQNLPGGSAPAPGGDYATEVAADSPISWWRLGETSGTTAVDEQAVQNGTYENSPTLGVSGAISDGDTAIRLAGGTDFVDATHNAAWNVTSLTVEAWVNFTSTAIMAIITRDLGSGSGRVFQFRVNAGKLEALVWNTAGSIFANFQSASTINNGVWRHVALTVDGSASTLYIDGVSDGTAAGGSVRDDGTARLRVGRTGGGSSLAYNGDVDEAAIYSGALTSARILAHYNAA